jgi:imidazolonepropionase-like amidohydrolase
MRVSYVAKRILYECGCCCEYQLMGFWNKAEWHTIPCFNHANRVEEISKSADENYAEVSRQLLNEHDCITYLREKGYNVTTMEV